MRSHLTAQGAPLSTPWQPKWGGDPQRGLWTRTADSLAQQKLTLESYYMPKKLTEKRNSCVLARKWWVYRCFFYHQAFMITRMLHIFFWVWQILTDKRFTGLRDAVLYWQSGKPPGWVGIWAQQWRKWEPAPYLWEEHPGSGNSRCEDPECLEFCLINGGNKPWKHRAFSSW